MTTLLAVDVGNTNTVLGVFRDGELAAHWRIQTIAQRTSDEYAVLLKTLLDLEGVPWRTIDAGIISSVVRGAAPWMKTMDTMTLYAGSDDELMQSIAVRPPRSASLRGRRTACASPTGSCSCSRPSPVR